MLLLFILFHLHVLIMFDYLTKKKTLKKKKDLTAFILRSRPCGYYGGRDTLFGRDDILIYNDFTLVTISSNHGISVTMVKLYKEL